MRILILILILMKVVHVHVVHESRTHTIQAVPVTVARDISHWHSGCGGGGPLLLIIPAHKVSVILVATNESETVVVGIVIPCIRLSKMSISCICISTVRP